MKNPQYHYCFFSANGSILLLRHVAKQLQISQDLMDIFQTYYLNNTDAVQIIVDVEKFLRSSSKYELQNYYDVFTICASLNLNEDTKNYITIILNELFLIINDIEAKFDFPQDIAFTFEKYSRILDSNVKIVSNIKESIEKTKNKITKEFKRQESKINDLIPQAISAVGIFSAVIVLIIGGLNLIQSFTILAEQDTIKMLTVSVFVGLIIFNYLFLLMFLLARLSDKPIHTVCANFENENIKDPKKMVCLNCSKGKYDPTVEFVPDKKNTEKRITVQCSHVRRAFMRYPYFYVANLIFFIVEIALFTIWFIQYCMRIGIVVRPVLFIAIIVTTIVSTCILVGILIMSYGRITLKIKKGKNGKNTKSHTINQKRKRVWLVVAIVGIVLSVAISTFFVLDVTQLNMSKATSSTSQSNFLV